MPRVLIADDEESMRTLVARAIAMDGHATVTAEDGAEALEILTRENGAFDLLLTDIKMPVMDGIALALAVARDFPDLTILLMTGFADQRERAHGLNAIVHDVVTKPFSVADIRTAVADALAAKKALVDALTSPVQPSLVIPAYAGYPVRCGFSIRLLASLEYWVTRFRGWRQFGRTEAPQ